MTLDEMMEIRARRIAEMAATLGIKLTPGSTTEKLLHSYEVLSSCAKCQSGLDCRSFTSESERADNAPGFCGNRHLFDALAAEAGADRFTAEPAADPAGFGGWMSGSMLFGALAASARASSPSADQHPPVEADGLPGLDSLGPFGAAPGVVPVIGNLPQQGAENLAAPQPTLPPNSDE